MAETRGNRFEDAFSMARRLHDGQVRKGTEIPYLAHLLAVAALVLEAGGDEDEAIAALLHDGPEDQGGHDTLADVRRRFGPRVADIVAECSDTLESPKPPWRERKESYLAHLLLASPSALRVSCADKLHNLRSIVADYRVHGELLWERFSAGRDQQLWYYGTLVQHYVQAGAPASLLVELERSLAELQSLVDNAR